MLNSVERIAEQTLDQAAAADADSAQDDGADRGNSEPLVDADD